ncbi:MAG: phage integrase SAM-like domain-containing protein, partial [Candidatus Paceibacterota bacterium]
MASLNREASRNGWRLQFRDNAKHKRSIWLGDVPEWQAGQIKVHVEHLLEAERSDAPPSASTVRWLAALSDAMRSKLAKAGLTEPPAKREGQRLTLGDWLDQYIAERKDVKASTIETYEKARDNLVDYFKKEKLIREITAADAKRWRIWLATEGNRRDTKSGRTDMADETVRRRTGKAKQFFAEAVERGLIEQNPFAKLPSTTRGNAKRQFFVAAEWIEDCITHAPCDDWKLILALCRYGGLRCPSEVLRLRWVDVNLPERRMTIHAPKTEHHETGGVRQCPIFPELRPYLEAAWDAAPEGAEFVITRYRSVDQNLRTTLERIIKRAGLVPWPRLFQNLRASRETELMAMYPAKDVAAWLGNSVPVAMRHYAMPRAET